MTTEKPADQPDQPRPDPRTETAPQSEEDLQPKDPSEMPLEPQDPVKPPEPAS